MKEKTMLLTQIELEEMLARLEAAKQDTLILVVAVFSEDRYMELVDYRPYE